MAEQSFSVLYRGQDSARTMLVILYGLAAVSMGSVVVTEGLEFFKRAGFWQPPRSPPQPNCRS